MHGLETASVAPVGGGGSWSGGGGEEGALLNIGDDGDDDGDDENAASDRTDATLSPLPQMMGKLELGAWVASASPKLQDALAEFVQTETRVRASELKRRELMEEYNIRMLTLRHVISEDPGIDGRYYRTRIAQQLTGITPPAVVPSGRLITLLDIVGDGFSPEGFVELEARAGEWYAETYGVVCKKKLLDLVEETGGGQGEKQHVYVNQFHEEHKEFVRAWVTKQYREWSARLRVQQAKEHAAAAGGGGGGGGNGGGGKRGKSSLFMVSQSARNVLSASSSSASARGGGVAGAGGGQNILSFFKKFGSGDDGKVTVKVEERGQW